MSSIYNIKCTIFGECLFLQGLKEHAPCWLCISSLNSCVGLTTHSLLHLGCSFYRGIFSSSFTLRILYQFELIQACYDRWGRDIDFLTPTTFLKTFKPESIYLRRSFIFNIYSTNIANNNKS